MSEEDKDIPKASVHKKRLLDGFRNMQSGKIFRHAQAQTLTSPWNCKPTTSYRHREVQTASFVDKSQQNARDAYTQMELPNYYNFPNSKDKVIQPNKNPNPDIEAIQIKAAIVIQKYARRWLAIQELEQKKMEFAELKCRMEEHNPFKRIQLEEEEWMAELEYRMKNPHSIEDFDLFFSRLQEWWKNEVNYWKARQTGPKLKATLWTILEEECKKIQEIESLKLINKKVAETNKRNNMLEKAATSKAWKGYKGLVIVDTCSTDRAHYLKELYATLTMLNLTPQDRITVLLQVKETFKDFNCTPINDLILLANREIDLLKRGMKGELLIGLRTRIKDTFWQIVRQPFFNPEMEIFSPNPKDKSGNFFACTSCNRYYTLPSKPIGESTFGQFSKPHIIKCSNCKYLENEGWIRKDLEIYKHMLKMLIQTEENKNDSSGIIYLLQPRDISHLVHNIWKSRSCISGSVVLKDMELTRWNIYKTWMPWNCAMMTRTEAIHHSQAKDLEQTYGEEFLKIINQRNAEAKTYFSSIPRFLPYMNDVCDDIKANTISLA